MLEKPLVEEVWVEKRRSVLEEIGGEGVVTGMGKTEEDVVREREWDDDGVLTCWRWLS